MEKWIEALREYKNSEDSKKNKVIYFAIGAGASIACGFPDWYGLAAEVMERSSSVNDKGFQNKAIHAYKNLNGCTSTEKDEISSIEKFYEELPENGANKIQDEILEAYRKKYSPPHGSMKKTPGSHDQESSIEKTPVGWLHSFYSVIPTLIAQDYKIILLTTNYDRLLEGFLEYLESVLSKDAVKSFNPNDFSNDSLQSTLQFIDCHSSASVILIQLYSNSTNLYYYTKPSIIKKHVENVLPNIFQSSRGFGLLFLIGFGNNEPFKKHLLKSLNNTTHQKKVFEFKVIIDSATKNTAIKSDSIDEKSGESPTSNDIQAITIPSSGYSQIHINLEIIADYLASSENAKVKFPDPRFINADIVECSPRAEMVYRILRAFKNKDKTIILLTSPWGGGKTEIINWIINSLFSKIQSLKFGKLTNDAQNSGEIFTNNEIVILDGADEPFNINLCEDYTLRNIYTEFLNGFINSNNNYDPSKSYQCRIFIVSGRKEAINEYQALLQDSYKSIKSTTIQLREYTASEYELCMSSQHLHAGENQESNDTSAHTQENLWPWFLKYMGQGNLYLRIIENFFGATDEFKKIKEELFANRSDFTNGFNGILLLFLNLHVNQYFELKSLNINGSNVQIFAIKDNKEIYDEVIENLLKNSSNNNNTNDLDEYKEKFLGERLKYYETITGFIIFLRIIAHFQKIDNISIFDIKTEKISGLSKLSIQTIGAFLTLALNAKNSNFEKKFISNNGEEFKNISIKFGLYLSAVINYCIQMSIVKKSLTSNHPNFKSNEVTYKNSIRSIEDLAHESRKLGLIPSSFSVAIEEPHLKFENSSTIGKLKLSRLPVSAGSVPYFSAKNIHFESLHLTSANWSSSSFTETIARATTSFGSIARELKLNGNTDFTGANFGFSAMMRSEFRGYYEQNSGKFFICDISESNFIRANCSDSMYEYVDFSGCSFVMSNFSGCTFQNCRFDKALIGDANFYNSKFINCTFLDSNIYSSEFTNCQFENVAWVTDQRWEKIGIAHGLSPARLFENFFRNATFDSKNSIPTELSKDVFTGAKFKTNKKFLFPKVKNELILKDQSSTILINGYGQRIQYSSNPRKKGTNS